MRSRTIVAPLAPLAVTASLLMPAAFAQSASTVPDPGTGGVPLTPADAAVLARFDVAEGTRQMLAVPDAVRHETFLPIVLDGVTATLRLRPHSVRGPDFQLHLVGADGIAVPTPAPISAAVRGTVEEFPGSVVAGTVVDGRLNAIVLSRGSGLVPGGHVIEPLDDGGHLVHRGADLLTEELFCGVDGSLPAGAQDATYLPGDLGLVPAMTCDVAIDTDVEYYEAKGSVEKVMTQVDNILGGASALYEEFFAIELRLQTVVIRTEEPDPFPTLDGSATLAELAGYWADETQWDPDVVQLFTGKDFPSLGGLAYLHGVCTEDLKVGLIEPFSYNSLLHKVRVSAHEFGHNFGANHCSFEPDCGIMCPGICGPADQFGQLSTQSILHTKLTTDCLELAEELEPPEITGISPESFPSAVSGGFFTIEGRGLITTTEVEVAGQPVADHLITILNDEAVLVPPPVPDALGAVPVVLRTTVGRSNTARFVYGPNDPPVLLAPWSVPAGEPAEWTFGGDLGHVAVLLLSASDATTPTPAGFELLAEGGIATVTPLNAAAIGHGKLAEVPASLAGLKLYSQIALFDDEGLDVASTVRTTNVTP